MNHQSHLKRALFALVVGATATAVAGTPDVCQLTSQDGLNSCNKGAQGDYWLNLVCHQICRSWASFGPLPICRVSRCPLRRNVTIRNFVND